MMGKDKLVPLKLDDRIELYVKQSSLINIAANKRTTETMSIEDLIRIGTNAWATEMAKNMYPNKGFQFGSDLLG